MSRRNKTIIIAVVAILVLLIILVVVWWLVQRGGGQSATININQQPTVEPKKLPTTSRTSETAAAVIGEPQLEATFKAVAVTFAERFGSYSNQSNFQNLEDLSDLMTVKMKNWADNFILEQENTIANGAIFYGITTRALSAKVVSFDESLGRAEISVSTQRQESKGSTINPRIFYQEILLKLAKTSDGWKVDEAAWQ